jgi:membrane protease subunit (stomatin/prohibitin family)
MLLVDGGKIIDYTAEEGYYTVKNEKGRMGRRKQ